MTVDEMARELLLTSPLRSILVTPHALAVTKDRLFPASKNRSRRIHKKLVKRFGGEFRMRPAAFASPAVVIVHPEIYRRIEELQSLARAEAQRLPTYLSQLAIKHLTRDRPPRDERPTSSGE